MLIRSVQRRLPSSDRLALARHLPLREAILRLAGPVLAEQNDEWTESRHYGSEMFVICKKAAMVQETNQNEANEKEMIIEAIGS